MNSYDIVLASGSPRRRELLTQIGLEFSVIVSRVEECSATTIPEQLVQELSMQKAEAVAALLNTNKKTIIIGSDTVVSLDGKIMGKPADEADAYNMLSLLAGNTHQVYTGVSLLLAEAVNGHMTIVKKTSFFERTDVTFYDMKEEQILEYVNTRDPLDKAGAYGIQGFCARYIQGIQGDYNNVVGLPVGRLYQELLKFLPDREAVG